MNIKKVALIVLPVIAIFTVWFLFMFIGVDHLEGFFSIRNFLDNFKGVSGYDKYNAA